MPSTPLSVTRAMCGTCVVDHIVNSPFAGSGCTNTAARLDRVRDQAVLAVALRHGHVRLGEQPLDLARLELPRVAAVRPELLVHERRAVGERGLDVDHRRQRLVVDLDELGRVLAPRRGSRDDDGDRVAGVARLVDRRAARASGAFVSSVGSHAQGSEPAHSSVELGAGPRGDDVGVRERGRDVRPS